MRIAILVKEAFSTYIYNLVAELYESGFSDVAIIKVPVNLNISFKNNISKFKVSSFVEFFAKTIELAKAYYRWNKINAKYNIKQLCAKGPEEKDIIKLLYQEKFDILVAYNTGILSERILSIPKFGIICAHPALLPFGRGLNVHLQSILANIPLGVTIFKIDKGIDTGDIYLQEELDISRCRSMYDLNRGFSKKELELTLKTIRGISCNTLFPKKQEKRYKYWKLSKEEIDKANKMLSLLFSKNKR
ncbi:MAG: hypothetical protein ISS47_05745 [Candidatus Omnitrophica bacterium]|nr:hypothetical protein [Candidatus Omnitrophota bacterium]